MGPIDLAANKLQVVTMDGGEGAVSGRRQRLLVVDDDAFLRTLFPRILGADRYEILSVDGPGAALRLCESQVDPVDLLVTDVIMPELKGPELHRRLAQRWPGLCVLFMSGYPPAELARQGIAAEGPFLAKPFKPESLIAAVEGALEAHG